jgi:hypothetical protein
VTVRGPFLLTPGIGRWCLVAIVGAWGDYDNDGDLDLYMTWPRALYRNSGDGTFTRVRIGSPVNEIPQAKSLASLPLGSGERERHMQIELACRCCGRGWLSHAQAARLAALDHHARSGCAELGVERMVGKPCADDVSDYGNG